MTRVNRGHSGLVGLLALALLLIAGAAPAFSSSSPASRATVRTGVPVEGGRQTREAVHRRAAQLQTLREPRPAVYLREKAAAEAGYRRWLQRHPSLATRSARGGPLTSVSGSLNHAGISDDTAGTPPDTTGSIGPSNYVEMVNSTIAVYSNSDLTAPTSTSTEETFTGDTSPCDGNIEWDQEGQRWVYSILGDCFFDEAQGFLYFGWSKTASPSLSPSNWCQYAIPTGSDTEDYPKLGHDDSQILIGVNDFGTNFSSDVYVFDKPAPGVSTCPSSETEGSTAIVVTVGGADSNFNFSGGFTPVPANIADSSADGYVAATDWDSAHLDLYQVGRDNSDDNALLGTTSVTVPAFCVPASVPQPGTSETLDDLDTRLTQAVAVTDPNTSQEGIWTQHAVAQGCSNATPSGPSVERWYELEPGATAPEQIGTVNGPNGSFAFMGAISPTADGNNAAIFYNSGSSTQLADFRVQDRHLDTTSGQMIGAEDLQLAVSPYADEDFSCDSADGFPCRWGDYSGASPDPGNPDLVWGTGELTTVPFNILSSDGQWGTQNAAIDVSPAPNYGLDVATAGAGSGAVTSGDTIIDCPGMCSHSYAYGTPVTLTATPTPSSHSVFSGWSGDCTGTGTCQVPMGGPQSVTATFSLQQETLSFAESGTGSGSVSSIPSRVHCAAACSNDFDYGTSVQLSVTPATGSTFTGWSGEGCSGTGTCTVSMTQARSVTASFTLQSETLSVSKAGAGSGTVASTVVGISCGAACSHDYDYGTSVTLTATPGTGSLFTGWSGAACSGTGNCTVPMTAAKAVTATFGLAPETLTVAKSGSGTVASTVAGIACGSTCSHAFDYGTSVTLTATASSGSKFTGWSGACSGTAGCTVSMTAAKSVTAKFAKLVCVVPKLKGKKLAAAKSALRAAHCGVGTVKKKTSTAAAKGKVVAQSPAPGKHLKNGARVDLVVGKGK